MCAAEPRKTPTANGHLAVVDVNIVNLDCEFLEMASTHLPHLRELVIPTITHAEQNNLTARGQASVLDVLGESIPQYALGQFREPVDNTIFDSFAIGYTEFFDNQRPNAVVVDLH